ncbi:putative LOB domain-containing protein [Tripterygium wilfordii]|uniref:Putative LOB domain-containing protein n=1 Tax=Tripterygium wilfordii TaxID=458696 RepID=A0A7J7CQ34_TRIWF|nr:LOB domain-containing protein 38-like [Tripterygium wilfordii]KAF5736215.1 putative LOB domain-containing protein [Tripterygium wilfordii]
MSCNGCRVLRKGCSESCILRPCLQWIESPESQGHATVFVAKFFGRAGLMSFISAVPENQRPALFQSLLFEACGRTVNPVNGAVGLLWTGNWHICQAAVETVLRGGALRPMPELLSGGESPTMPASDEASEVACTDMWKLQDPSPTSNCRFSSSRSKASVKRKQTDESPTLLQPTDLHLRLTPSLSPKFSPRKHEIRRPGTPSMNSEESVTTTCFESGLGDQNSNGGDNRKLLNLFV